MSHRCNSPVDEVTYLHGKPPEYFLPRTSDDAEGVLVGVGPVMRDQEVKQPKGTEQVLVPIERSKRAGLIGCLAFPRDDIAGIMRREFALGPLRDSSVLHDLRGDNREVGGSKSRLPGAAVEVRNPPRKSSGPPGMAVAQANGPACLDKESP